MKWSDAQEKILAGSGNMLVSASAGSGKTAVMIEKVIRLLKGGADIRRILMMTFTRAAAREMREKLVKKMYEEARAENGAAIKNQIAYLPFANIDTIDGFCYSLARKYFNVAGCDPAAAVGEENAMKIALGEAVERVMERAFATDEEFNRAADYFRKRRSYEPFKETVIKIIDFASTKPDREKVYFNCANGNKDAVESYYLSSRKKILVTLYNELTAFLNECTAENYGDGPKNYAEAAERMESAAKSGEVGEFIATAGNITVPAKINARLVKSGKVSEYLAERSAIVNERIKAFVKKVKEDGEIYARKDGESQQNLIKRKLAETCVAAEKEYAAYKKRKNLVDIGDATGFALKILSDEKAREEIGNRFDYIFVDEYQDTNYLQENLIEGISRNNVFSVGDVKQAIYHFRAAEPEIFLRRGERYDSVGDGENYYLNTNYRSCDEVLDFTNRVCDRVMIKDFCGIDYKNTARLSFGGSAKAIVGVPPVRVFLNREEDERPSPARGEIYSVKNAPVEEKTDRESEFVAAEILSLTQKAFIEENGVKRKAGFGDVAVLLRKSAKMKPLSDAFERNGIPYYTLKENSGAFPERESLVDAVRVILNADNDAPLYNALVSPVGGFSDEIITVLRAQRFEENRDMSLWESLNTYKGDPNIEKKAKEFVDFIEEMRIRSAFLTAEEVMREVLSRNFDAFLKGKNPRVLEDMNAFISFVGGTAANSSCEEFIEFYDTCYRGNKPPVKENAVAVMTMHGSKGLEFPIVFLPYQDGKTKNSVGHIEIDSDLGLAVKLFSEEEKTVGDSFESRVIRMKCRDEERKELARLMYVAFTRAKNCLVISGKDVKAPINVFDGASVLQWVLYAAESDEEVAKIISDLPVFEQREREKKETESKTFDAGALKREYEFKEETVLPMKYSVSEILKKRDGYGFNPFEKKGEAATAGTAVHTVMQYIDYETDTIDGVKKAVEKMTEEGLLTEREASLVDSEAILKTLESDIIREAKKYPIKREQPFVMYVDADGKSGKVLVQGVIDLLIDEGDGYVVVDFKTGWAKESELADRYASQLALYAQGVEKILKKPVKRRVIWSVCRGTAVDV